MLSKTNIQFCTLHRWIHVPVIKKKFFLKETHRLHRSSEKDFLAIRKRKFSSKLSIHFAILISSVSSPLGHIWTNFKVIVPTILAFLKKCYKVAKLKDDIIKHRLNRIASIKNLVKHQLRVNKGLMHNGQVNNRVSVYQTKIWIGD